MVAKTRTRSPENTRRKLVEATVGLILRQGFNATSVDQICSEAGVTKGSFFHHFPSKEAIGQAAVGWWGEMGTSLYSQAWKDTEADPLDQLYALFAIMESLTRREDEPCHCLVGMMSQELAGTHPVIREACARELTVWTDNVARILVAAKEKHPPVIDFDPEEVAWFLNSIWQGSMLIAKNRLEPAMIRNNIYMACDYVDGLFGR